VSRLMKGIFIISGLFASYGNAQELLDEVNFRAGELGGLHIVGLSVFGGYSTSAYPQAGLNLNAAPGIGNLGGDASYGAGGSVGWQRHREKTDISALYSGTYDGMVHYSNLNAYNQSLSISVGIRLTPKWTFSLAASGQDQNLAQYLFQPSASSVLTQVPSTFNDLAAAVAVGQFSNSQVASMLTGAPVLQLPGRSLLAANRILSYAGQANLDYAWSPRLRLHFATFTAAGQNRLGSQLDSSVPANYVMPRSFGANAGVGFTYSLSPRTDVGLNVEGNRTVNHYQSAYLTSAMGSIGRKMGMHWFFHVLGGASHSEFTQLQTIGTPKSNLVVGGASLGFKAQNHTFLASYNRTAADSFGFAVGTITSASGAWTWRRTGSKWGLTADFAQQQTKNTGFADLSGWQATGSITSSLNAHTTLTAQYVYLHDVGTYVGVYNNFSMQSVRLSLGWAPQPVRR
jgi:hypothetical protein